MNSSPADCAGSEVGVEKSVRATDGDREQRALPYRTRRAAGFVGRAVFGTALCVHFGICILNEVGKPDRKSVV